MLGMAKARLLAPWTGVEDRSAIYHVVSRVVGREFLLGRTEKEQFVKYMRLYEAFCGVRVLTYCIMSNHFHILLEVPPASERELSDAALLEKLEGLYSSQHVELVREQLSVLSRSCTPEGREAYQNLRETYTSRMWDMGLFMKTLKQRFTSWYNKKHGRRGTLWEARYKSVLVENGLAARTMAAYIDLNPVRAGMVKDPKDYRWCGYGEAIAGNTLARNGVLRVISELESDLSNDGWSGARDITRYDWRSVAGRYRLILFDDGVESSGELSGHKRRGFTSEAVEREEKRSGQLSVAEIARCKTRYFIDGAVLGSQQFVEDVVTSLKGSYLSANRKGNGGRLGGRMKSSNLWSLRKLAENGV